MKTLPPRIKVFVNRIGNFRFLVTSIFIHVVLVGIIGGFVLFKAAQTSAAFLAVDDAGSFIGKEEEASESANEEPSEFEEPVPATGTDASSPTELAQQSTISSLTANSSWQTLSTNRFSVGPQITSERRILTQGIGTSASRPGKALGKTMDTFFGNTGEEEGALVGYLYDLKQSRGGRSEDISDSDYHAVVSEFVQKGWNEAVLKPYYRTKKPLSTYQIFIPLMSALAAPAAFKVESEVQPSRWVIHYKGTVTAPESGTFRFVGKGDDILAVRFDQKDVLDGSLSPIMSTVPNGADVRLASSGPDTMPVNSGAWFTLHKGQTYPLEILIGEQPGGDFWAYLLIERKSSSSDKDEALSLPLFQTARMEIPKSDKVQVEKRGMVFTP